MNDLIPSIYHSKEMFDTTIQRQTLMVWLQIILLQKRNIHIPTYKVKYFKRFYMGYSGYLQSMKHQDMLYPTKTSAYWYIYI